MSLINEALRKAQSQRAQSPGLGDNSKTGNQPLNYVDRPNRLGLMIGLSLCVILLLGLVTGLTVVLLSKDTPLATAQTETAEPRAHASGTTNPTVQSTKTVPEIDKTTKPETELSKPAEPAPEIAKTPVAAAKPNQGIVDWLSQSTVTAVRITSSSSKVILNNDPFTPGDSVNMNLGLKVSEIEAKRIIFIDSNGIRYVKLF